MKSDHNSLMKQQTWTGRMPVIVFLVLSLLSIIGVVYITVVDVRYLLTHLDQLNTPGITDEIRLHLEWEIGAEAIKIFLDLYLFLVVILIIAPGLLSLISKQRLYTITNGLELAARMFLTRVENLSKWLIGLLFLRLLIHFFQRILRLETGGEADIVFSAVILVMVIAALLFFPGKAKGS